MAVMSKPFELNQMYNKTHIFKHCLTVHYIVGMRKRPNRQYTSYPRAILFTRVFLSVELSPCSSQTCLNGGTCIDDTRAGETTTVSCACPLSHTGQRCESKCKLGRMNAVRVVVTTCIKQVGNMTTCIPFLFN